MAVIVTRRVLGGFVRFGLAMGRFSSHEARRSQQ
jgi:hypothetical protein